MITHEGYAHAGDQMHDPNCPSCKLVQALEENAKLAKSNAGMSFALGLTAGVTQWWIDEFDHDYHVCERQHSCEEMPLKDGHKDDYHNGENCPECKCGHTKALQKMKQLLAVVLEAAGR